MNFLIPVTGNNFRFTGALVWSFSKAAMQALQTRNDRSVEVIPLREVAMHALFLPCRYMRPPSSIGNFVKLVKRNLTVVRLVETTYATEQEDPTSRDSTAQSMSFHLGARDSNTLPK